jgi:hypothetical protein
MKKKASPVWTGLAILVLLVIAFGSGPLMDRLFAPWAFDHEGRPALTGLWVGRLTTATGQSRGVLLELLLPKPNRRHGFTRSWRQSPHGTLGGSARVCDPQGQVRSYTVDGKPADRQATQINFFAGPSERPVPNGLTLSWVQGTWDGANQLDLRAQLHWEKDGAAISGDSYPDTQSEAVLTLTRGGEAEFQAVCDRLQPSR